MKQIDFYIEKGYADSPATFFSFQEEVPEYSVISEKPYADGKYQVISFPSGYETKNPLIREEYNSFEENKTGYLVRWTHGDSGRKTVLWINSWILGGLQIPRRSAGPFLRSVAEVLVKAEENLNAAADRFEKVAQIIWDTQHAENDPDWQAYLKQEADNLEQAL